MIIVTHPQTGINTPVSAKSVAIVNDAVGLRHIAASAVCSNDWIRVIRTVITAVMPCQQRSFAVIRPNDRPVVMQTCYTSNHSFTTSTFQSCEVYVCLSLALVLTPLPRSSLPSDVISVNP